MLWGVETSEQIQIRGMRQLLSPLKKSAQLLYLKQASLILCLGSPPPRSLPWPCQADFSASSSLGCPSTLWSHGVNNWCPYPLLKFPTCLWVPQRWEDYIIDLSNLRAKHRTWHGVAAPKHVSNEWAQFGIETCFTQGQSQAAYWEWRYVESSSS